MKSLFTLSFLWAMSIGILIIPSLFPAPAYINVAGIILILSIYLSFDRIISFDSKFILYIVLYISISCMLAYSDGIQNLFKQFLTLGLLAIVFKGSNRAQHIKLLKVYVIFCFLMSISGTLASLLVNLEFISLDEFKVSLTDLTNRKFIWDEDLEFGFTAPYGLGLVLTKGSSLYYFLGTPFYRSAGWSYEPTFAAFFVTPALILVLTEELFTKRMRFFFVLGIIFFLICCFSVASMAALLVLYLIYSVMNKSKRSWKNIIILFIITIAGFYLVDSYNSLKASQPGIDIIESKLTDSSLSSLNIFVLTNSFQELKYLISILIYVCLILSLSLPAFKDNGLSKSFGLIMTYFVIHSAKGSWYHTMTMNICFIFFLFLLNEIEINKKSDRVR